MKQTVQEMHIAIDIGLQRLDSNREQEIRPEEKDIVLNDTVAKYITGRVRKTGNNQRLGFEDDMDRYHDLEELKRTTDVTLYEDANEEKHIHEKTKFKLFDFFANYEYFEEKFDYDQVIDLPEINEGKKEGGGAVYPNIEIFKKDYLREIADKKIDYNGMRIDRELFQKAKTLKRK